MKTKRKRTVLKWRKASEYYYESECGTFSVQRRHFVWNASASPGWSNAGWVSAEYAKAACERLAQSILHHCVTGAKDGK